MRVEALTAIDMATKEIYPAVNAYVSDLCANLAAKKAVFASLPCDAEETLIKTLATANENLLCTVNKLKSDLADMPKDEREAANRTAHVVVPDMQKLRAYADEMERLCSKDYWPFPDYYELLYSVK